MIVNALLRGRSLSQFKNLGDCDLVILANDTDQEIQTIDGLKEYLIDPSSVKEDIPHPSVNFLSNQDLDYLITYLLSLGSTNE